LSDDTIEFKSDGLKQLLKALESSKINRARVGVLGDKTARTSESSDQGNKTNAEIGAKHEFGDDEVPIRSFLRVPISEKMQSFLEDSNAFNKEALAEVIKSGSIEEWLKKLGILGEQIVAEAFATGGFGQWPPSNMKYKKNHQTLIETQQLRNSVTSDVK
jgi:hypothetical protein